jgi:hypothetical protein
MQTPSATVQAVFDALNRGAVSDVVGLVHPEALSDFHARQLTHSRMHEHFATAANPDGLARPTPGSFLRGVFKVASINELEQLAAAEVLTRWLRGSLGRSAARARIRPALDRRCWAR